jgi:hypothetical protein
VLDCRAGEPCGDLVVLGHEIDDRHEHVREGLPERGDPPAGGGGHSRCVELVEHIESAGIRDFLDEPPDDGLVVLRHGPPLRSRIVVRPLLLGA